MKFFNSFACIKSLNVMKTNELYGLKKDMNKSIRSNPFRTKVGSEIGVFKDLVLQGVFF